MVPRLRKVRRVWQSRITKQSENGTGGGVWRRKFLIYWRHFVILLRIELRTGPARMDDDSREPTAAKEPVEESVRLFLAADLGSCDIRCMDSVLATFGHARLRAACRRCTGKKTARSGSGGD